MVQAAVAAMVAGASPDAAAEEPYAAGNWHSEGDATGCQEGLAGEGDREAQESWAEVAVAAAAVAVPVDHPWPTGPAESPVGDEQMLLVRRGVIAAVERDGPALGTEVAGIWAVEEVLMEH